MIQLARRSHLHPVQIIPASDETPGEWAPCPTRQVDRRGNVSCCCPCIDTLTGQDGRPLAYHRLRHAFDGDGACLYCGKRQ